MASTASDGDKKEQCTALTDEAANYDFVRFALADIHGISRCKVVPRRHVADMIRTGITMCSSMTLYLPIIMLIYVCVACD